jgi:protein phosphatase 2C family protein 2/3
MKEFHKTTSTLKDNLIQSKFPHSRRSLAHENLKIIDQVPKNNLPELKLTKLKIRPGSDPEKDNPKDKDKNKITTKTGLKYVPFVPKMHKNHTLIKKAELMFPKIKNATNTNFFEQTQDNNMIITNFNKNNNMGFQANLNKLAQKRKNIHSKRSDKIKTLYGTYGINIKNINNNNLNTNSIPNKKSFNDKLSDIEKSNAENMNNSNNGDLFMVNLHKIKPKIPKYPKSNKSLSSKTKIKKNKKDINFKNSLTIKPLINYPKNNNYLNNFMKNPITNNTNNIEQKINLTELNQKNPSIINNTNYINNITLTPPISNNNPIPNYLNVNKPLAQSPPPSTDIIGQGLESPFSISSLLNLLALFSGGSPSIRKEPVELSPEIFKNTYNNFTESITSSTEEFEKDDIIKGYAFNTSMGNIRDYNEDTITATKIILDGVNDSNTFFFAVYDGHGGNGCSLYLKEKLHHFIKNFTKESLNEAINTVEEKFMSEEALDEKGEIKDPSGSCGIMALIQKNKLIIANVGDSRLVLFKKNSLYFSTEDHKPGSPSEKTRIEKGGGMVYQTPSLIPLRQNGKEIEPPWRVLPGRLSVSRTFGDVEAKNEKLGGMKNVVVALPDITEIELDEDFNFMVLGCDGIFDVLSNEEILECVKIVLKEKEINDLNNVNISELCGYIADMIIKSSLAKDSYDNVSCIVVAINMKELINN